MDSLSDGRSCRHSWQPLYLRQRFAATLFGLLLPAVAYAADDAGDLGHRVQELIRALNAPDVASREDAEKQLVALASTEGGAVATEQVLGLLPQPAQGFPPEVKNRLIRIRRRLEDRLATSVLQETIVDLNADRATLSEVWSSIEEQTGNRIVDLREQFGQEVTDQPVTIHCQEKPFWEAIDELLDKANLGVYSYSPDAALALVTREQGARDRTGAGTYSGPFRFEALTAESRRGLRNPSQQALFLTIEISWEPRLQPIALLQPMTQISATGDGGQQVPISNSVGNVNVEVQAGVQATQMQLSFELPSRTIAKLARLQGTMETLIPGRVEEFRFDRLSQSRNKSAERAGVVVTLIGAVRNGDIWEVHMKLRLRRPAGALASHRDWVLGNTTFLTNAAGDVVDHVGFETILQSESEVGVAYFFDINDDIDNYTWVYKSPAAIVRAPIEYSIPDILLP